MTASKCGVGRCIFEVGEVAGGARAGRSAAKWP